MRIAIISCYKDPDYVRARVLRTGLTADPRVKLIVVKNKYKSLLRYPEVIGKVLWLKIRQRPDAYVVTFRGYEILPFVQLVAGSHPVVFDELINLVEYVVYEHHKLKARGEWARWLSSLYTALLRRCEFILADTSAHAAYSAALSGVSNSLYRTVPVGTDETVFNFAAATKPHNGDTFEILFIGNMKPMYGLYYVMEAAEALKDNKAIRFIVAGGSKVANEAVKVAQANGAHVTVKSWIPFNDLPKAMCHADLCLAGQFGDTEQSKLVITTKTYQMLALGVPAMIGRSHASGAFTDKEDCLIVSQGDSAALVAKIRWAYENRKKLERIGKNGRKLYDEKFSNKVIAKKLSSLVDELAKS